MTKAELDVIIELSKLRLIDLKKNKNQYIALLFFSSSKSLEELRNESDQLISNLESAIPKLEHMKIIARE